ncbi:hypothetical protein CMI37_24145 [Candidatus Pacearchaeota archaeon]|nr:hypothetical protein [Candidatus Pacearchaeota archaeon]
MKRFDPIYGEDDALNRVQRSLEESIGFLRDVSILDGKLVEAELTAGSANVAETPHGLGRDYVGVILCSALLTDGTSASVQVEEYAPTDKSRFVRLLLTVPGLGTQTANVKVWVF